MAGVFVLVLLEWIHPVFTISDELLEKFPKGAPPPTALVAEAHAASAMADGANAILCFGLLGMLVAAGFSFLGQRSQDQRRMSSVGIAVGAALGLLFGCLGGVFGYITDQVLDPIGSLPPLAKTILVQCVMLVAVGAGVGLAWGFRDKVASHQPHKHHIVHSMIGGMLSGLLAGLLYCVLVAILFPAVNTTLLVPKQGTARILWIGLVVIMQGVLVPVTKMHQLRADVDVSGSRDLSYDD